MTQEELKVSLTGLVPVIHAFPAVDTALVADVGAGQIRPRGALVLSVGFRTCSRLRCNTEPDSRGMRPGMTDTDELHHMIGSVP